MTEIFNEDCVRGMKTLSDASIDLTVTSPPYDNLRTYNGHISDFKFEPTAQELFRVTKQGGVVVWIVNDATINGSETGTSFKQALYFKEIGFNLHDTMIWQKTKCSMPERVRYCPQFEYMFVFSKGRPKTVHLIADKENKYCGAKIHGTYTTANGTREKRSDKWIEHSVGERGVRWNIWQYSNNPSKDACVHPATFPLKLAEDHIKSWSDNGDTVLDCFTGSGTTGVACVNLNRNFIGYEIDEKFFALAQRRIKKATSQKEQSLFDYEATM